MQPHKMLHYQAYYRVDEDREELRRGGAVASGKIVTEYIDVEATSGETISGGWKGSEKDDCGKKGMKFVFRSSDEDCKWSIRFLDQEQLLVPL